MNQQAERFAEHLLAGDTSATWNIIDELRRSGHDNLFIYEHLITAAMHHVGDLWERNEITVADEHLASAVCEFALAQHTFSIRTQTLQNAPRAMFFCLADEHHQIGANLTAALFAEHGWDVRFLGANLPLEHAVDSARKWEPQVIGLSISTVHSLPYLNDYLTTLQALEHRPTLLIGGRLAALGALTGYASDNVWILTNLSEVQRWLHDQTSGVSTSAV